MTAPFPEGQAGPPEAEQARYALRSAYYYRMVSRWDGLRELIAGLANPDWADRAQWGIGERAWTQALQTGAAPVSVFCHPEVIAAQPRLIAYYRCLALLPQKGMQLLAVNTANLEEGRGRLNAARAGRIAVTVNGLLCALIDADPHWQLAKAHTAALLNLGSQINGSWRNAVGSEGGRQVKQLLIAFAWQQESIASVLLNDGSEVAPGPALAEQTIRELRLTNGARIVFSSEPDVALRDAQGNLVGTVEIKYGLDPAAALERYGAAKKSFDAAVAENARVSNVYLVSCLTPEVRRRIATDRVVNADFNLTEVLNDGGKRAEFLNYIRRLLEL